MKDVIVIGGGASGLISAIKIARSGLKVTILERNNNCGKKILISGSGKCNYFNDDISLDHYRSSNLEMLDKIINNKNEVLDFFDSIGIVPRIKNGYYYPFSNMSSCIQNSLILECNKLGVEIINNIVVNDVEKDNNIFFINTSNGKYKCRKIIFACGSKAFLKNNDFCAYDILKKLGHNIIKPLPGLVQLVGCEKYFKDWNGIRLDAYLTLMENGEKRISQKGELQLTNYGISGIVSLNISSIIARGLDKGFDEVVYINFVDFINDLYKYLEEKNKSLKGRNIIQLLESIINYKLLYVILKKCNINTNSNLDDLSESQKKILISNLTNFELRIIGTKDFMEAQVVSGGVSLEDINPLTCESKIINNLYIVGELLDVDGECGGYNLGFAWMSGLKAGESCVKND